MCSNAPPPVSARAIGNHINKANSKTADGPENPSSCPFGSGLVSDQNGPTRNPIADNINKRGLMNPSATNNEKDNFSESINPTATAASGAVHFNNFFI